MLTLAVVLSLAAICIAIVCLFTIFLFVVAYNRFRNDIRTILLSTNVEEVQRKLGELQRMH